MNTDRLYSKWIEDARTEARAKFSSADLALSLLVDKTSTYARSIEAMRNVRLKALQVFDAAPSELPAIESPKPMTLAESLNDMELDSFEIDGMSE